eukprot:481261-Prorocentrum_minimum.AAC.1
MVCIPYLGGGEARGGDAARGERHQARRLHCPYRGHHPRLCREGAPAADQPAAGAREAVRGATQVPTFWSLIPPTYGLVGQNGMGKTTLLNRVAAGDIKGFPKDVSVYYIQHEILSERNDSVVDFMCGQVPEGTTRDEVILINMLKWIVNMLKWIVNMLKWI